MKEVLLTGTITVGEEIVTFVCDDFKFTFVRAGNVTAQIRLPLTIKTDSSGYIWGTTRDDKSIAIFTKQDIVINHTCVLGTWNYIVFKIPVYDKNALFDGIRFFGGSIKSINPCHTLSRELDVEDELHKKDQCRYYVYKAYSSVKKIDIELGENKTTWIFENVVNSKLSIDEGTSLKDGTSVLRIAFEHPQSLTTMYNNYGYVSTLVAFMTYRSVVSFDRVTLVKKCEAGNSNDIADCHIKVAGNAITRKMMNSMSVHCLSENSFKNIVLNVVQVDKKHMYLPLDFLPKDDKDFCVLTKDRLRNICSALEVEMDLAKISASKDDELKNLIASVKGLIKESRDSKETHIEDRTYDNIFNSIGHWGDSVTDRAIIAWDMYTDEIVPLMNLNNIDWNAKEIHENIARFVRTRNKITHEGFNELDENLAITARLLSALVYCMAMRRLEIENDKIKDLMVRTLIG